MLGAGSGGAEREFKLDRLCAHWFRSDRHPARSADVDARRFYLNGTTEHYIFYGYAEASRDLSPDAPTALSDEDWADFLDGDDQGLDTIEGGVGDDQIDGGDSPDVLHGEDRFDFLSGGRGADRLLGYEDDDRLIGGEGDDTIHGGAGADAIHGESGFFDLVSYVDSDAAVTVDLSNGSASGGQATGDVLTGIEQIAGSEHGDVLTGDDQVNALFGEGGADRFTGGLGDDSLSRGVVPAGPHKGFGGEIDGTIACGGVAVSSGDLIIGDADGVTVVPFAKIDATLEAAKAILAKEERALASLAQGGSLAEVYGVPEMTVVKG